MPVINVSLQPFRVPNYVLEIVPAKPRQEGFVEAPKHALSELPADTLAQLCDRFRAAVFEKAGKQDPTKE